MVTAGQLRFLLECLPNTAELECTGGRSVKPYIYIRLEGSVHICAAVDLDRGDIEDIDGVKHPITDQAWIAKYFEKGDGTSLTLDRREWIALKLFFEAVAKEHREDLIGVLMMFGAFQAVGDSGLVELTKKLEKVFTL